jgi:hypothetical protein
MRGIKPETPLPPVTAMGCEKAVERLPEAKPDVNARGRHYNVTLQMSIQNWHMKAMKQLLGVGPSIDAQIFSSWREVLYTIHVGAGGGMEISERLLHRGVQEEERVMKFKELVGRGFVQLNSRTPCRIHLRYHWYQAKI